MYHRASFAQNLKSLSIKMRGLGLEPQCARTIPHSDGTGYKFFDPGQVNFLLLRSGRISHLWFGSGFGKFPLKIPIFSFSPLDQKNLFGFLFTVGQKYALVVSGPISIRHHEAKI